MKKPHCDLQDVLTDDDRDSIEVPTPTIHKLYALLLALTDKVAALEKTYEKPSRRKQ